LPKWSARPRVRYCSLCVRSGCQTNICDSSDAVRPLHVAVGVYNDVVDFEHILACLVDGGCELDARALGCETALYRSLDLGKADLATLLLQYGADVDVECPHGVTILNKVSLTPFQSNKRSRDRDHASVWVLCHA